jgi:D-3-phosphoglycerate dehydrogenase / 2-oxoglutarate reductase
MATVVVTDHSFPSIELQHGVFQSSEFQLKEAIPICRTEGDVINRCADADVLLVQWAPITRTVLEALPKVRCVVRYGVGVDNIDLSAAKSLGVTVANVPDYCLEEVSNHALAMICSLCRRIPHDHDQIRSGGWGIGPFRPIPAFSDLRLGLVGFGAIARKVAEKAKVFGYQIIASDPYAPIASFSERGVERVDQRTLLSRSDVISLHCPLLPETKHVINQETIALMKPGTILVNTARGGLIKEPDLIAALQRKKIGGAGLDVFEIEPLPANSPLRNFNNVILTSHSASVSEMAIQSLQVKAATAACEFLKGNRLRTAIV